MHPAALARLFVCWHRAVYSPCCLLLSVAATQKAGPNSLRSLHAAACGQDVNDKVPCGASDPGGNTFQTVISIDGAVVKLGEGLADHVLNNFGRAIDALESRIKDPTLGPWQRSAMAKRIKRLHRRARNAVKQAAHEYALLIACRFKVFFLPHFRVSAMVEGSPLGRTVSRKLMAIGHAEFRRLLMEKAAVHGCRVVFVRGMLVCLFACLLCLHTADHLLLSL